MALNESLGVFRRVYANPDAFMNRQLYASMTGRYALNWGYYVGSALDEVVRWSSYRSHHRLYRYTRNIYNPTRRLVDFYAGTVYPGVLTADARRFEDGTVIAIPFPEETPQRLTDAIASLWKWSNWHVNKGTMVRYAAVTGVCLVEIVDDVASRKINYQVWFPSVVTSLNLDYRGNVDAYTIEYSFDEPTADGYATTSRRYKKTVDKNSIRTYRDDVPYDYDGNGSTRENPYGFCPAVWVKHTDIGSDHGEPCMRYMSKWDELNSIASHWLDQAHRVLEAPLLVTGDNIQQLKEELPASAQLDSPRRPDAGRTEIPIIRGPLGSRIESTAPPSGEVMMAIDHLLAEVEKDHPELTMWNQARKMSQVTGVSLGSLFGDVGILVREARNNYDLQSIKLFQMSVAIGGYRANEGHWGEPSELSPDRSVFLPFDLGSYDRGDLDLEIADRPLIPPSRWEVLQAERSTIALERERLMLEQTRENPLGGDPGLPSGDMATQPAAIRQRLRAATEGALSTEGNPGGV